MAIVAATAAQLLQMFHPVAMIDSRESSLRMPGSIPMWAKGLFSMLPAELETSVVEDEGLYQLLSRLQGQGLRLVHCPPRGMELIKHEFLLRTLLQARLLVPGFLYIFLHLWGDHDSSLYQDRVI